MGTDDVQVMPGGLGLRMRKPRTPLFGPGLVDWVLVGFYLLESEPQ